VDNFFNYLEKMYNLKITDEMEQIASWNKEGIRVW
jgi:hypothetical protein